MLREAQGAAEDPQTKAALLADSDTVGCTGCASAAGYSRHQQSGVVLNEVWRDPALKVCEAGE